MAKYVFPAIFTHEECGYSIRFPDIESCYTSSASIEAAMVMAEDVLCLTLYDLEENGFDIPVPSDIDSIKLLCNETVKSVKCDTDSYRITGNK